MVETKTHMSERHAGWSLDRRCAQGLVTGLVIGFVFEMMEAFNTPVRCIVQVHKMDEWTTLLKPFEGPSSRKRTPKALFMAQQLQKALLLKRSR